MASMIPLLARAPDDPAMLRCRGQLRVVTGVPFSPEDRKIWHERFGVPYLNTFAYGQTEANMVTFRPFAGPPAPIDSMGPPSDEYEVMVAGDDNVPVPIGETGELVVRPRYSCVMFSGYWNRPEDTLKAMTDLWWYTGDFVRMDENGYLYFVDRKKDYLRSRGENISSFEVESAIMQHPAVKEVACHAVPGPKGVEEDIKATLVMHADLVISETALFQWMVEQLPYFAIPRFIEFRAELPKTPTGRIQKHKLRDEAVTQATWDAKAAGFEIRRNMKVTR
jgi:crotonobetaine/carnitine-CoA ligase